MTPTAELPTLNKRREEAPVPERVKEITLDSQPHENNPKHVSLEDKVLENLDNIERGLKPYLENGRAAKAIATDFGVIDMLASDKNDNFVVLKVKMGLVQQNELSATLASVGWLKKSMKISSLVRVIMIAESFDEKTIFSANAIPNLELMQYEIRPTLTRLRG